MLPPSDDGPPIREHQIRVERTARYHVLGSPGPDVRACWFVLHGYGQLAESLLRRCSSLAAPDALVVAPEALSRFYLNLNLDSPAGHANARVGASWMTHEAREAEIADYIGYLERLRAELGRECGGGRLETRILGFSQGVATAVRWAVLGAGDPPRTLVLWAGSLPTETWTDAARTRLAGTELVLAAGDADPFLSPDDLTRTADRLETAGYRVRPFGFPGGHTITPELVSRALVI
ncbi:MAG: alpha/beta hydrolase [Gemmatimonadales bacterium]